MPLNYLKSLLIRVWRGTRKYVASDRLRRYRTLLFQLYVLVALLAFSFLALAASLSPNLSVDIEVTRELQEELPQETGVLMQAISWPGYAVPAITIVALTFTALSVFGLRWEAISILFAAASSFLVNYMIKIVIRRPRPSETLVEVFQVLNTYSFPSGHVMFYTAFFGFLLFLAFILPRHSLRRTLSMIFLALLVALVGISRMYLGEHWASDVIAGYLLGSLSLILTIEFYRWGKTRYFTDQPVAASVDDEEYPALDPKAIVKGVTADERHSARPEPRARARGSSQTNPVPQTGRSPDDDAEA